MCIFHVESFRERAIEQNRQLLSTSLHVARKSCQALRDLIIVRRGADAECLERAKALVRTADTAVGADRQCAEVLAQVLNYAQDLYSPEGREKWVRPRMSADSYLRLQILAKLSLLHNRLAELEQNPVAPQMQEKSNEPDRPDTI